MLLEYLLDLSDQYKKAEYFGANDLSDKFTALMMVLLLVGSAATSYKFFVNSPLVCFTAVNPTGENFNEFATNYIWTHGAIPSSLLKGKMIGDLSQWNAMLDSSGIHYYQWVPLILLLQCLSLFLCRYLWQSACSTNVSYNFNTLLAQCQETSPTSDSETIQQLAHKFLLVNHKKDGRHSCLNNAKVRLQEKLSCLGFSRRLGNWMSSRYMAFKVATVFVCIAQAFVIAMIFEIGPSDLSEIWSGSNNASSIRFPRSVVGFVPNVAVLGSYNSYSINCVMSVNIINEKLFILLQPTFIILAAINALSLFSWLSNIGVKRFRRKFIKTYFPASITTDFSAQMETFISEYLRWDGTFMLRMIKKSCDNHLVRRLIHELWFRFLSKDYPLEMAIEPEDHFISSDQIHVFLSSKIDNSEIILVDPFCCTEILDDCGSLSSLGFNVQDFQLAALILAPVNIANQFWVLFVYDTRACRSYMLDPSVKPFLQNEIHKAGLKLTEEINGFCKRVDVQYVDGADIKRVRQSTYDNCGPLVCGYAILLSKQQPLTAPIDIDHIRGELLKNV